MNTSVDFLDVFASAGTTPAPRAAAHDRLSVSCVYCRGPIAATTFVFWSDARRLISATCPGCDRRVTLATSTWRRWLKQSPA
ncbi:MAG: hypothetical protein QOG34_681 [Frankiaceae bacterium]|nr:hypothetical protein [Frankiaceae bacterium]